MEQKQSRMSWSMFPVAAALACAGLANAQTTQRVSLKPDGTQFTEIVGPWIQCDLSGNGTYAVFTSMDSGFSDPGTNIYRRNLVAGGPTEVVVAANKKAELPRTNLDGSVICFASALNLTTTTLLNPQIYVTRPPFDTASIELVSEPLGGGHANNSCIDSALDDAGLRVVFDSVATNLTADVIPTLGHGHIYLRNLITGSTQLLDLNLAGLPPNKPARHPEISGNGLHVVFASLAIDLVAAAPPPVAEQIYVHDSTVGALVLISKDAGGAPGTLSSWAPSISVDGRFVAFHTMAPNLVPAGPGLAHKVVLHDRDADGNGVFDETFPGGWSTTRVSVDTTGNPVDSIESGSNPRVSADGSRVLFCAFDTPYGPNPLNRRQVWLWSAETGQARNVHVDSLGGLADGHANPTKRETHAIALSNDGTRALMTSSATNLDPLVPDTNGLEDLYAHDLCENEAVASALWVAGQNGLKPELWMCGRLSTGPATFRLRRARPLATAVAGASLFAGATPFACGTLLPLPPIVILPGATDAIGARDIFIPSSVPLPVYIQFVVVDPDACGGFAFSNGLMTL